MRPNREPPIFATDEISMIIRHAQVVNGSLFAIIEQLLDLPPLAIMATQAVTAAQVPGSLPSLVLHPERVRGRGLDDLSGDMQVEQACMALEDFLNLSG